MKEHRLRQFASFREIGRDTAIKAREKLRQKLS